MTDQSNEGAPVERANLPAPAARSFIPVSSPVPLLDTAAFEHMNRIARAMATASLMPPHIVGYYTGEGRDKVFNLHPFDVVIGNCLRIVSIATRWEMDPYSVAECSAFVHGRLMFEGKVVAAALDAKLGVRLKYEFGTWDAKTESVVLGKEGEGDSLGVVVSGAEPGVDLMTVEGSVGGWKTTGAGSPWRPGAMKRQLRYRGAREWARAHRPGIMLGIYTDDEMESMREDLRAAGPRSGQSGSDSLIERLRSSSAGGGQAVDIVGHVARETGESGAGMTIENEDKQESDAVLVAGSDGPGEGVAETSDGGSSPLRAKDPPPDAYEPAGQDAAKDREAGKVAAEPQNPATPDENAGKQASGGKGGKKATEKAAKPAEKQPDPPKAVGGSEPEWMADMSAEHLNVYDSVVGRLQEVKDWAGWRQFKKDYRDSARGIVEGDKSGFPAEARDHLLKMMDAVQEKGGW